MKTRADLFIYLEKLGIAHTTYEHEPLFTVEQADKIAHSIPGCHIKNLFLKDANGGFWLLVAQAHTKIELKKVMQCIKAPKLRFADAQLLKEYLGVLPGSVTPFGLINDVHNKVGLILDHTIFENVMLCAHPLENNATTCIRITDFKKFLDALGYKPIILNLTDYTITR